MSTDLEQQIAGIAALDEPVRRALYLYVAGRGRAVSRDEASRAAKIGRGLAAHHLDVLVEEGLLEASYRKLSKRGGPGSGRPAKMYRRSDKQLDITFPPRRYRLAARLFARTIEASGTLQTLEQVAHRAGASLGRDVKPRGRRSSHALMVRALNRVLAEHGFEPVRSADGEIRLHNCPFHALVQDHRDLMCGANLAFVRGVLAGLGADRLRAELVPHSELCCVAIRPGDTQSSRM